MKYDLFINVKKEKAEKDPFVDTYNDPGLTTRENRGLNCPSSINVQEYLRAKGFLP